MSEQPSPEALRDFFREAIKATPNILKGITDYGIFTTEENAQRYLDKVGLKSVKGATVDKIFVKNVMGEDIYAEDAFVLSEDVSLWSILEAVADVSRKFGLKEFDDYKSGLVMKFDERWLCVRQDVINPKFGGEEGVAEVEGLEETKRYEIVLTYKPEEIDWMSENLYD